MIIAIYNILDLLRIKDWLKNIILFLPLIFSGQILNTSNYINLIFSFIIFSLAASFIYIINDIIDSNEDTNHPIKKYKKPIADNRISLSRAYFILLIVFVLFNILLFFNSSIFLNIYAYIFLNLFYNLIFKKIPLLDIIILSFGYVIRLDTGSITIDVNTSLLMIITIFFLSFFIISLKRIGELNLTNKVYPKKFNLYTHNKKNLRILIYMSGFFFMCSYHTYIFTKNFDLLYISPLIYFLLHRYFFLTINTSKGEYPIDLVIKDKILFLISLIILTYFIIMFI